MQTQGVASSKKKKQAKLKRVIAAAKKQIRTDEDGKPNGVFAALQLLNDPQGFAEKLFARLQVRTCLCTCLCKTKLQRIL